MTKLTQKILITAFAATVFTSCNLNDIPDTENLHFPDYKGNVALTVGRDTVTVGDFLRELIEDSSSLQIGDSMDIMFIYRDTAEFNAGTEFIQIAGFRNRLFIDSPIDTFVILPVDTVIRIQQTTNFNFPASGDERIDSVFYRSGRFELEVNSGFPGDVSYSFLSSSFQELTTGQPIDVSSTITYQSGDIASLDSNSVDLLGYKTILAQSADSNTFAVTIDAFVNLSSGTTLTGNEYIYFELDLVDPEFSAVFGDFGQDTFNIESQDISFDVFTQFAGTGLSFENPTFTFDFENSFGVNAGIDFSGVYGDFEDPQPDIPLQGDIVNGLQLIAAPTVQGSESIVSSQVVIDNQNSNIAELFASTPSSIIFPIIGISNPNGENQNFLRDGSRISILTTISLPLSINVNAFEYESDFELGNLEQTPDSEEVTIIINTENELPLSGELEILFVDDSNNVVDSIPTITIFNSPTSFDQFGKVTEPALNTAEITLTSEKFDALINSANLRIITRLFSYGYEQDQFVQIFADYSLINTVSVRGKVSIKLDVD